MQMIWLAIEILAELIGKLPCLTTSLVEDNDVVLVAIDNASTDTASVTQLSLPLARCRCHPVGKLAARRSRTMDCGGFSVMGAHTHD